MGLNAEWRLLMALSAGILCSCAQVRSPSGGMKDEEGPKVIKSIPANGSTRFIGQSIFIEFDEYVTLQQAKEQVLISPPLRNSPDILLKAGKTLVIDFKDEVLQENTTYTINLGSAIKDNNEGNELEENVFLFSTGEYLDSLMISGQVNMARFDNPCSDCSILAFPEGRDSLLSGRRPNYVARCDASGRFTLSNLAEGRYDLIALKDLDKDLKVDDREPFGFLRRSVNSVQEMDSTLVIRVALRADTLIDLKRAEWSVDGRKLLLTSKGPTDSLDIRWPEGRSPAYVQHTERRDSTYFWFRPAISEEEELYVINGAGQRDTVRVGRIVPAEPKWNLSSPLLGYKEDTLLFNIDRPLSSMDTAGIKLYRDTVQVQYALAPSDALALGLIHPWEEGKRYTVTLDEGSLKDLYGVQVDSSYWPITVPAMTGLGLLSLDIALDSSACVISLMNKDLKPIHRTRSSGALRWNLPPIPPGKYQVWIFKDENGDGEWTRGHFDLKRLPEPVYFQQEPINVRANWEMEMSLEPVFTE
jgi:uncharacterized protein (DUF2141 family)